MEWRFYDGVPHVSTFEFHEHRDRAPHLEQPNHRPRMDLALQLALNARGDYYVDLGCGDGGMLQMLKSTGVQAIGFDFQPSNVAGWVERGVEAYAVNFVEDWGIEVPDADVYMITEVLEHLADPHTMVHLIRERDAQIVASSPHDEHAGSHDECHAWAWDVEGYAKMMTDAGFTVVEHVTVDRFQVLRGVPA